MVTYPSDWKEDKVSNVVDISTGCRDTQDNKVTGRYPFFVRSPIVERIDVADYDCEAVLTAGDGVGTGKVFHYYNGKFAAHQRVYVMNNFRDVDGKYFFYFFSKNFIKEVEKYTAKSSVDSVRRAMIADMAFTHPQLPEQQEIVRVLEVFDTYIADLTELIEKKRGIRDGAIEELISGNTRVDGYSKVWEEKSLVTLANILNGDRGINYPSDKDFVSYGIPFVNAGHLQKGKVCWDDMNYISESRYRLLGGGKIENGDILFCLRGSLGKHALVNFTGGAPASSLCIIRAKEGVSSAFLAYLMESSLMKNSIEMTNTGSSQPNLSAKDISKYTFFVPTELKEQEAIASVLSAIDDDISNLEAERDKMIQIREGAMDDLLTGKVRLVKGDS